MNLDIFTDDWKKIPANLRFFMLAGGFLIFNTWLLDHWGGEEVYRFWGMDIRAVGYSLGLTFIFVCFSLILVKQFLLFKSILIYRMKYPVKRVNQDFFMISFRGYVVLFDKKTNKYHHIVPFETAQDLLFVDQWSYSGKNFPPEPDDLIQVGSSNLYHAFKLFDDGGVINTRA